MAKKKVKTDYEAQLKESFSRWDFLYAHGGCDPFYTDGVNLNLIRNHVTYYKKHIEGSCSPEEYPQIYFRETPPEVDNNYMARADEIRENAENSLKVYREDKDYQYLKRNVNRLTAAEKKHTSILNVLNYVEGLKHFISTDDLVSMRRHEDPERYIESFRRCAEEVRKISHIENRQEIIEYVQCSLF